ncbi:MAG: hypothetical protein KAI82_11400 [Tritonibacter mobilis]|nr:hypothetical protein [Tritonibacter mobilis]
MELVLHAGTHKTATSTFQAICSASRDILLRNGICYPEYKSWSQHSFAAWDLQSRNDEEVEAFLMSCISQATGASCTRVLLSGEDFENCLVDTHLAVVFENVAKKVGFSHVKWIVVHRDPFQYIESIYSEKSKYGVNVNIDVMCKLVLKMGFFSLGTRNYNYKFVFDIKKFVKIFKLEVSPEIEVITFDTFKDEFVGKHVFSGLGIQNDRGEIEYIARGMGKKNSRLSAQMVERLYACNLLGIKLKSDYALERAQLLDHLVKVRLAVRERTSSAMRDAVRDKFS